MFRLLIFLCIAASAWASKTRTLYDSLDPQSVAQHLAFYQLYFNAPEGDLALKHTWHLLGASLEKPLSFSLFQSLHALVNKPIGIEIVLSDSELQEIEQIAQRLPHRQLKGHQALNEAEVLRLESSEIDLARGVLLSQQESMQKIRSYEALLDLMALQILARVGPEAAPEAKIRAINRFIFEEMGFRFPPHSLFSKEIDRYTFLPSVLDSHRGVCLGVSILYICLAQRLNLPMEMVTPPGHIYVRYRGEGRVINIETTARGIHLDCEEYLGVNTRSLKQRNVKEVIGLAHFNQAAVFWQNEDFEKAIHAYQKAMSYMPDDKLLKELLAYQFLFTNQKEEGERLLRTVVDTVPDDCVTKRNIAEDYLNGQADAEAIRIALMEVDETREALLKKRKALEGVLERFPRFRMGLLQLAVTWEELYRAGEALEVLKRLHEIDPRDVTVEYYLAECCLERFDYRSAWRHLRNAERLCKERGHAPKALKNLRRDMAAHCPD